MKDDSLSDTQIVGKEFSPNIETNVYATKIWNEAIEAAAIVANEFDDDTIADQIRKLKK